MDSAAIIGKFRRTLEDHKLVHEGDTIVVAVSGGPDSVALLHMFWVLQKELDVRLVVAHMNHQFRGEESDREAQYVEELASRLNLTFEKSDVNMPAYIREHGVNAEAAARTCRYAFLHECAEKHKAKAIALGHHADDQAETVLMRLIRGSGPKGLSGMTMRRAENGVQIIRPLLELHKQELIHYCNDHDLTYYIDSSNLERDYFRNRIRLDLMPLLVQFNPNVVESVNRLAEVIREEDDYLEKETMKVVERYAQFDASGEVCRIKRNSFLELHSALQRRLIKLILNYLFCGLSSPETSPFEYRTVETVRHALLQSTPPNLSLDLPGYLRFEREYEDVVFRSLKNDHHSGDKEEQAVGYQYSVMDIPNELVVSECGTVLKFTVIHKDDGWNKHAVTDEHMTYHFDLDQIQWPLAVRNRRPGDRLEPYGLNGSKKVKDMFIDKKLAPSLRDMIPFLVDREGNILAILGFRRSRFALVDSGTRRILKIRIEQANGNGL